MQFSLASLLLIFGLFLSVTSPTFSRAESVAVMVGTAKIDITPELPIHLSGFESRKIEATRAETRLFARALAIGSDEQKPAVLITLEVIGVGAETSEVVATALRRQHGIPRERLALSVIHTHTGPALSDVLPFMFASDLPTEETARIGRYTAELRVKLIQLATDALANRQLSHLAWAQGTVGFAAQRRVVVDGLWKSFGVTPEGPVDHAVPVLRVTGVDGAVRAVFLSYACHCTTLNGSDNYVHHDWAGDAAQRLEAKYPGAIALVALGCGADANPNPRGVPAVAEHGSSLAQEVERLLGGTMVPLGPLTTAKYREVPLEFDRVVSREELQQRVQSKNRPAAYAASQFLQQLDSGRPLPTGLTLPVQTWTFGDDLTWVFLGGEVVSEYALRLRRELDGARLWINAYSNNVPCYIPSQRMYAERGYEVDGSMDYYGWPTRLAADTEDRVIAAVHDLVPVSLKHPKQP